MPVESSLSTEEKIKEAAKQVFLKKGFAGTKTRDIADHSGENLALINYYFRSKENLFRIVMNEIAEEFWESMIPICNDIATSIDEKIEAVTSNYIDLFISKPEVPFFVMNEIREGRGFSADEGKENDLFLDTVFHKQLEEKFEGTRINPDHMIMNLFGMIIFPFIGQAIMVGAKCAEEDKIFLELMEERKKMVPVWMRLIIESASK